MGTAPWNNIRSARRLRFWMNRSIISGSLFENRRGSAQSSFHWLRLQLCDEFSGIANVATKAPNRRRCPEFSFVWMRSSSRQLVRFARHGSHLPYYPIEWLFCSLSRSHHSRVMDQADIISHHSADSASTCQRLLAPPSCAGLRRAITGPRAYLTQHLPMGGC